MRVDASSWLSRWTYQQAKTDSKAADAAAMSSALSDQNTESTRRAGATEHGGIISCEGGHEPRAVNPQGTGAVSPNIEAEGVSNQAATPGAITLRDLFREWGQVGRNMADLNGDGIVNAADLGQWLGSASMGTPVEEEPTIGPPDVAEEVPANPVPSSDTPSTAFNDSLNGLISAWGTNDSRFDLSGDGTVNALDLAMLLSGTSVPPSIIDSTPTTTPAPTPLPTATTRNSNTPAGSATEPKPQMSTEAMSTTTRAGESGPVSATQQPVAVGTTEATGQSDTRFDLNNDGTVDAADLAIMLANYIVAKAGGQLPDSLMAEGILGAEQPTKSQVSTESEEALTESSTPGMVEEEALTQSSTPGEIAQPEVTASSTPTLADRIADNVMKALDKDGDGAITANDLGKRAGRMESLFKQIDQDGDGSISRDDMLAAVNNTASMKQMNGEELDETQFASKWMRAFGLRDENMTKREAMAAERGGVLRGMGGVMSKARLEMVAELLASKVRSSSGENGGQLASSSETLKAEIEGLGLSGRAEKFVLNKAGEKLAGTQGLNVTA